MTADQRRYRAFLSYSHRDEARARQIHRELESWRAERDLVGRRTPFGPAPRTLRPIFRDRDDFSSASSLSSATQAALEASDAMIVLCSPASAQSRYVGEEISAFQALGRGDRILPLIIDGEPGDPERDCFAPALRAGPNAPEPLAADAREQGDGPRRAIAKVIAGLLGVPFDEIVRRAERAERRRQRVVVGIAASMAVLAVAAGGFAWLAETRRMAAERNFEAALSASDSLLTNTGVEIIGIQGVRLETAQRIVQRAIDIHAELERSLPRDDVRRAAEMTVRRAAAEAVFGGAFRNAGQHAAAIERFEAAREGFAAGLLTEADRATWRDLLYVLSHDYSVSLQQLGRYDEARARIEEIPADVANPALAIQRSLQLASLDTAAGDAEAAFERYAAAARELRTLRADEPDRIEWMQFEVVAAFKLVIAGQLIGREAEMREWVRDGVAALEALLERNPDLINLEGVGAGVMMIAADQLEDDGDPIEAARLRQRAQALAERQLARAPDNQLLGTMQLGAQLAGAVSALERGDRAGGVLGVRRVFDALDLQAVMASSSSAARSDLELAFDVALQQTAAALLAAGLPVEARRAAELLLSLRTRADAPAPAVDRAAAHALIARAAEDGGDFDAALSARKRQLEIARALAEQTPPDRGSLADALGDTALLLWRRSRRAEALPLLERRADILEQMIADAPEATHLPPLLAWTHLNIGELSAIGGDAETAAARLRRAWALADAIHRAAPEDRSAMLDLGWMELRLAGLPGAVDAAARRARAAALFAQADALSPLSDANEEGYIAARLGAPGAP